MRPKRPFDALRVAIYVAGYQLGDIAALIGIGNCSMSLSINGKRAFTMDEAYAILGLLHLGHEKLPELFPPRKQELAKK